MVVLEGDLRRAEGADDELEDSDGPGTNGEKGELEG
jgi:hypothetical protein